MNDNEPHFHLTGFFETGAMHLVYNTFTVVNVVRNPLTSLSCQGTCSGWILWSHVRELWLPTA